MPINRDALEKMSLVRTRLSADMQTQSTYLQVALRLHEAAHNTKCRKQLSMLVRGHGRYDGVVWALVWTKAVRMQWVDDEVVPAVLQSEATAFWHNAWPSTSR